MQTVEDFAAKFVGETKNYVFDFTSELAPSETISSATVTATVYSGTDGSPSAIINGADTTSGPRVTQSITGGVAGVIYYVVCSATTSASQILRRVGYIAVLPNVPA